MEVKLNIQPIEELFYYYTNWQSDQKNKIHRATCAFCNYGTGMRRNVIRGKNGVWIGPFSALELCIHYVEDELGLEPNIHTCSDHY